MKQRPLSLFSNAALATGLLFLPACSKNTAPPPAAPPDVLVTEAASRDVPVYRDWIGTLDGSENADIRARVTGYLLKREYQEGAPVKKGDLLFEIDARPFEAALAEAKSQLAQARAIALASIADAERAKQLFNQKVISEQEFTNKTQLGESNRAKVAALEANVEQAQLNLSFCRITSPVDGIAGVSQAQVGDLVGSSSGSVLTSVSTLDPIKLLFPISEQEYYPAAARIQEALAKPLAERQEFIELILADGTPFPHKARIMSIDRQVKASTGTILVTAVASNPNSLLRPGQFARARVVAQMLTGAVVIPQRAVLEIQGSHQIAVIGPDNKAEIRPVTVGARVGSDWVITSGLKAGERVVVEGLQKVKTGQPVSAKPWTPPAPPAATGAPAAQPATK